MKNRNQIVTYCKSPMHKKVIGDAAKEHLFCRSTSSYVAAWITLIVKYIKKGVTIEDVVLKFDESVELFKRKTDGEESE